MTNSPRLAPLILFIYNRPAHLGAVINSLKKNNLAIETDLIVFSDGPKTDDDIEHVESCRALIKDQHPFFKSLTLNCSKTNQGLSASIISALNKVFETHSRAIILEDDLVCSEKFLEFMNKYLTEYEDNHDVISIHAYCYPVNESLPDIFFLNGADCWGWGTWARGWKLFNQNSSQLYEELLKTNQLYQFDYNGKAPFAKLLSKVIKNKSQSWAIRWHASAILQKKLTLYPRISFVQNIGNDASGTNSKKSQIYHSQIAHTIPNQTPSPIHSDIAYQAFRNFFHLTSSIFDISYLFFFHKFNYLYIKLRQFIYFITHVRMISFTGPFDSWEQASSNASGYDNDLIINKTVESTKIVLSGKAIYEKDTRLFFTSANEPIVERFLSDLPTNAKVIDFGGSLASLYFRHKNILMNKNELQWHVIEQKKVVAAAKLLCFPPNIHFNSDATEELTKSTAFILANSLQYIRSPIALIEKIMEHEEHPIIFFRMLPTAEISRDLCFIQKVPSHIYSASYPIWIFSLSALLSKIQKSYVITTLEFDPNSRKTSTGLEIKYASIIAKKKDGV